jgi:hypothetical protein
MSLDMQRFNQEIGYDVAIKNEKLDGLILIDFRKIVPPEFSIKWPYDRWDFFDVQEKMRQCFYFEWGMRETQGGLCITARVCDSYKLAQKWFLSKARAYSRPNPLPWKKCSRKIGTVCAESDDREDVFFFYNEIKSASATPIRPYAHLMPTLFDRLRDDAPHRRTELANDISLSQSELLQIIQRDLGYLLNTINMSDLIDAESFPEAEASTINYGIPPLAGGYLSEKNGATSSESSTRPSSM